jgi:hypothetical protein
LCCEEAGDPSDFSLRALAPSQRKAAPTPVVLERKPAQKKFSWCLLKAISPTLSFEYAMPNSGRAVTYLLNLRSL